MGIPNLAHRRRHGQEWQSRCKLAMSKLAIYVGYHWPVSMWQPTGRSRRIAVAAHPGFPVGCCRGNAWGGDLFIGSEDQIDYGQHLGYPSRKPFVDVPRVLF